jgi:hypothetical protein
VFIDLYARQCFELLFERGLELIAKRRTNMKNSLMPLVDKILLCKRSIIETVNDQLPFAHFGWARVGLSWA